MDRATRCILSWELLLDRSFEAMQEVVDRAPRAPHYFSDGLAVYQDLYYYDGQHRVAPGKSQTYSVEAVNAELRHYLARLHRRTRCFSKCLLALRGAVRLFVHVWNAAQLQRRAQPNYPTRLIDFVSIRV